MGIVTLLREMGTKYGGKPLTKGTTMKVRDAAYDYLVGEARRTKRTPQGQMELIIEMFEMIAKEFNNDDPDLVKQEIARLKKKAGEEK